MFVFENFLHEAADLGLVVHDQDVTGVDARGFDRFGFFAGRRTHVLAPLRSGRADSFSAAGVCATSGKRRITAAPPFLRFIASMLPPCSSTMRLTIASPRPVPFSLLVTYGSNTWCISG